MAQQAPICHVYLCCRDLQGSLRSWTSIPASVSNATSSGSGVAWNKHWFVAYDYDEENVVIAEGDNVNEVLMGQLRGMPAKEFHETEWSVKKDLGCHSIEKSTIFDFVTGMQTCGLYDLIGNNCQKWSTKLLSDLHIEVPSDMWDAKNVFTVGTWAIAAVTILGAGYRLCKELNKQQKRKQHS